MDPERKARGWLVLPLVAVLLTRLVLAGPGTPEAALPNDPVPGGVAAVALGIPAERPPPEARFQGSRVWVLPHAGEWWALVGLPLSLPTGAHQLEVAAVPDPQRFTVGSREYARQDITLKNQRQVDPDPEDLRRIEADKQAMARVKQAWSADSPGSWQLDWPARGPLSSPFGLRRYFNGQPRAPHSGLDIAAGAGTPVKAPLAGSVTLAGDLFFNGNSIALHHGQGFSTLYCHLRRIDVREGQQVAAGEVIGAVGQTGRATGPHLHLGVILNGAMVSPSLFLAPDR
jgi:murein DD-endopeptidase MepM/ murein hydrolase activator NlpD